MLHDTCSKSIQEWSLGIKKPWQPETWQDSTPFASPGNRATFCTFPNYTESLEKKEQNPLEKIWKNPVETAPRNCRFLSLLWSNTSWILWLLQMLVCRHPVICCLMRSYTDMTEWSEDGVRKKTRRMGANLTEKSFARAPSAQKRLQMKIWEFFSLSLSEWKSETPKRAPKLRVSKSPELAILKTIGFDALLGAKEPSKQIPKMLVHQHCEFYSPLNLRFWNPSVLMPSCGLLRKRMSIHPRFLWRLLS